MLNSRYLIGVIFGKLFDVFNLLDRNVIIESFIENAIGDFLLSDKEFFLRFWVDTSENFEKSVCVRGEKNPSKELLPR